ncbi:class I adenylate-forming enzyme family protein [Alteriqipengyuania flavescens]|uniref:class I adenylate-forming enzyme family protein n=1 Tax=Alteriqipengyuania flavescens TaxID=3053610 RepID=UPI0025B50F51|nr:class I adenylate-forming enzyme family protein [Alteriqipengyuania flavescens]WJY19346.1 class I adenylate-forming enzyme family protein [Alteriqipengyuania flavescens]WJY25287.1 class I adenylate-forming enzyme family protein [Alteriqipengyuania flavescens]
MGSLAGMPQPVDLSAPFGSFPAAIASIAAAKGENIALRDDGGDLSWRDLADRVERIAARLQDSGLEQGQAVAILGTSSIAYALAFLAAVRAGGVAAPLTTSASSAQLAAMLADSGARHIFIDRGKLAELGEAFGGECERIVLDEGLDDWMAPQGTSAQPFAPEPGDPFNIIYSSGTTGTPKGIVHSHAMRWRQFAPTAASYLGAGIAVRSLASTPLYSNTTMVGFLPVLLAGGTVRIMGKFDAARWLAHAEADRTTVAMLVPVQYGRLLAERSFDRADLSALRIKYCTSAPFSAELKAQVLRRMPGGLIEIYSMTEGGVVCLLPCHEFPDKLHTVGRPAPGSELKVLDEAENPVPPGTPGNLVGRSHTMMSGYRGRPEATAEAYWTDPATGETWQRMGDIGRVDVDGFVELVGRAKDMIISGGFNIYPSDLEAELEREDAVIEAAVVGIESDRWGETPVGFAVLEQGGDAQAVLDAVNARLGKTQRLSALHAIDAMPRSHIGKLLKTELREEAKRLQD